MSFLSPNPILLSELRQIARSRRVHLFRILYLASFLASAVVVLRGTQPALYGPPEELTAQVARLGKELFYLFVICQSIGLGVLAPALSAGVIAREKESRTLELLLTTRVGISEIVWHKVVSHILSLTLLTASAAPIFFMCMMFGGVAPYEILAYLGFVAGFILICCGTATLFSAICRTTAGSLIATYAAIALVVFIGPYVVGSYGEYWGYGRVFDRQTVSDMLLQSCSFANIFWCYVALLDGRMPRIVPYEAWAGSLLVSVGFFIEAMALSSRLARQSVQWQPRRLFSRAMAALDRLFEPKWIRRIEILRPRVPVGRYPVLWRECHTSLFGKQAYFIRIVLALYVAAGLIAMVDPSSLLAWSPILLCGEYLGYVVILVTCGSATIAKERQSRSIGILFSTPLTPGDVLWGKVLGVVRRAAPVLVLMCLHLELMVRLDVFGRDARPLLLEIFVTSGAFFLAVGMVSSTVWRNASRATLAALFISAGVLASPFLLAMLAVFSGASPLSAMGTWVHGLSPFTWILKLPLARPAWWRAGLSGQSAPDAVIGIPLHLMAGLYTSGALIGFLVCRDRLARAGADA